MGDDPIVISSGQVITPESVMSRSFTAAFRGFHPAEVRQFLKRVSDEMAAAAVREVELRRALQEALERAAHPDLDEATVTDALGDHAAGILATARQTAASIIAEAQQRADALVADGEARAARVNQESERVLARRVAEADAATQGVQQRVGAEAQGLRERAQAEADAVIEAARAEGRQMVVEARALRERMLDDLARRRRAAQLQVEQLRAARDRLLSAYEVVRRTLDEATAELTAAEPEARMAAEAVARRAEASQRPEPHAGGGAAGADRPLAVVADAPRPAAGPRQPQVERAVASGSGSVPAPATVRQPPERRPAAPAAPDRPPMRPQTVADAVAGRQPAAVTSSVRTAPTAPARPEPAPATPGGGENRTGTNKVEELFSRLRAERRQAPQADSPPPPPPPAPPAPTGSRDAAPSVDPPSLDQPSPDQPSLHQPGLDPVASERALAGRDELLDNVESGLARALKRVLQNEQNAVLDNLRRLGVSGTLLPDPDAHLAAYRDTALPWLQQAARAGAGFVSDPAPDADPGDRVAVASRPVDAQAQALAAEVVEPLRERVQRAVTDTAGSEDPAVAGESLRTVYRQWKAQQMDDAARHYTAAAFSSGAFAATPDAAVLLWLVDDDGHCPDCDDNALAGPTAKGQSFPTGQAHPPAHRGCRCLLVPATT